VSRRLAVRGGRECMEPSLDFLDSTSLPALAELISKLGQFIAMMELLPVLMQN
jgi:hypothetical protein